MATPPPSGSQRPTSPPSAAKGPDSAETCPQPGVTSSSGGEGAASLLVPGARPVPDYELVQRLGRGGFGEVWKATGPGGVAVALKFIALGERAAAVELRSLELIRDIRHPHLLGLFGVWQQPDRLILAMELGDGTLLERLHQVAGADRPGIVRDELLQYMRDAARGIDYLNGRGIQHRDLKPQNLLLVGGGVKVADFGLAKLLEHTVTGHTGSMTLAYAAPEFFAGQTSGQSDQYALAVTYCQLRGGRLPFEGNQAQVVAGHMMQPPDLTMLPEAERPAVARALAKNPPARWPSCQAFVEALAAAKARPAARPAPAATAPLQAPGRGTPAPGRRPKQAVPTGPTSAIEPVAASTATIPARVPVRPWRRWWLPLAGCLLLVLALPPLIGLVWWGVSRNLPGNASVETRTASGGGYLAPPVASGSGAPLPATKAKPVEPPPPPAELAQDFTNSVGMKLVLIPAGSFTMGSPKEERWHEDDEAQHRVEITRPFYMGIYVVTQEEYVQVTKKENPSWFSSAGGGKDRVAGLDTSRFPVEQVYWEDADAFCQALSRLDTRKPAGWVYRLPTEAEWEYACRARTQTAFHYGDALSSAQANFDGNYPYGGAAKDKYLERTTRVGSYEPNAFGLYDMHGNVYQWCQDWYDAHYYANSPAKDPPGPDKTVHRALRAGSWYSGGHNCRAAHRSWLTPGGRINDVGFRVVCVPPRAP
jgi:formylglycine-generating enzyme required for sulfatase activity